MDTEKYIINVFCDRTEILSLIGKAFNENKYEVRYQADLKSEESIGSVSNCIITDKKIETNLRKKIIEKFGDIPIVYLPALDNENRNGQNVTFISEPLKLSELKKTVESLLSK